jgi:hypothetical protein
VNSGNAFKEQAAGVHPSFRENPVERMPMRRRASDKPVGESDQCNKNVPI